MIDILIPVVAVVLFLVIVCGLFGSLYFSRKKGAPYFPTPKRAIREALKAAALAPGESFYDLGAGTGNALLIAEREFGAHATGFEVSWIFWLLAKANLFIHGSHAHIQKADFFKSDIGAADVIFCFLAIRSMKKMEDQLLTQAKPGARIISYAFPLPTLTPREVIVVRDEWKLYLYQDQITK